MTLRVVSAPACVAVDTSAQITPAQAKTLAASTIGGHRVRGVARYVSLTSPPGRAGDITRGELAGILAAGLGCWLVQHVRLPGWTATADLGQQLGAAAVANALAAAGRVGPHLAVDQEGCRSVGQPVIDFLEAWAHEVVAGGFLPLVYDGFAAGLTAEQLYSALPDVHLYWSDYGPRTVAVRGFAITQHPQQTLPGLPWPVDADTIAPDLLGGRLQWLVDDAVYVDDSEATTLPDLPTPTEVA